MAEKNAARQIFDLLVTQDFDPESLDSSGKPAADPGQAEIFSFDFVAHSGKNYGTVVIMLGDEGELELFFGDNIGKTMEGQDKEEWYAFMQQIKQFATKNFMTFGSNNINRLRYSMQGQAAIKEGLFESWHGTKTTSYNDRPDHVRLMIRHKKNIGEGDARYRYIDSLFLETSDGERFKLPFTKLAGGRAMVEHVRSGGKPYDARGQHIAAIVEELGVLARFRRANHGKVFEGDTEALVTETNAYYENLNRLLKGLGTRRGYGRYFESWNPSEVTQQDVIIENLRNMFVRTSLDERIEQALPILAKISQQGHDMKEANIFEAWADQLLEGVWALPETPRQKQELIDLLSQELPVGADATNATEQLYDLVGDDLLFDRLQSLAQQDANADARPVVIERLQQLAGDPAVKEVLQKLDTNSVGSAEEVKEGRMSELDMEYQDWRSMDAAKFLAAYGMTKEHWWKKYQGLFADRQDESWKAYGEQEELDEYTAGGPIGESIIEFYRDDDYYAYDPQTMELKKSWSDKEASAFHNERAAKEQGWAVKKGRFFNYGGQKLKQAVKESRCNMTAEGEHCPVHGLSECGYMEESKTLDDLARLKTLAGTPAS